MVMAKPQVIPPPSSTAIEPVPLPPPSNQPAPVPPPSGPVPVPPPPAQSPPTPPPPPAEPPAPPPSAPAPPPPPQSPAPAPGPPQSPAPVPPPQSPVPPPPPASPSAPTSPAPSATGTVIEGPICECGYTYCAEVLMAMDKPWTEELLSKAYCSTPQATCADGAPPTNITSALYICLCEGTNQDVGNHLELLCGCDKCLNIGPDFRGRCQTPCSTGQCGAAGGGGGGSGGAPGGGSGSGSSGGNGGDSGKGNGGGHRRKWWGI
ncbi:Fc.00g046680.m01.CDS01 [Cosmosporella sp. VM-42]